MANGTRLPLDALDTLSSNNIRISAQAYFDAARAASLRALQTPRLDQQAADSQRQRAWKDQGNAQLLNRLADTMDSLKARHQQLEQHEQQNIRLRVQHSELKQQNSDKQQRNAELERQVMALKQQVQDVEAQRKRITERAKNKYREMQNSLDEKKMQLEDLERAWVMYMATVVGTIPGVHSSSVL
ncbi:uncharacterized protein N0V89_000280 [Didymosphaeria variabile]|uniref:Uncharacterized protein n=1 Tax=Didymosphaeria variabile TaxID=1932322 RepID=A0A9W8XTZ5_9PLEO|nr:uncharacterized protein N0V89_000280 [Didymosphaeria variabile]KAJ4359724.1 hypothetical protein N0V89_000280 [Didymosphaeria variabile]